MAYPEKRPSTAKGSKGKASWRVKYVKPDGTEGSESGFPTRRTALEWGRAQEAAIREGRWVDPDLMRKPFGKFAREWMSVQSPRGRTVSRRWDYLEDHILPRWEHTPLISISWFDVESWSRTLTCDDTTVGHVITLMSQIMTGAVDAQHLTVNPLYGRRRTGGSVRAGSTASATGDEEKWAPPEAVIRLADRLGPARGLHVLTTAFTGLNWGESLAISRESLGERRQAHDGAEFVCPVLRVTQEVAEYEKRDSEGKKHGTVLQLEPPKNPTRARSIDLPPFLAALLRRHLLDHPHEYLFCTPSGTWWRRSNWGRVLRPAADGRPGRVRRQGASYREAWEPIAPGLTMRALRHTHDTYQDQIGVRPALAFEQAGHRRPGIKGVYQHPTPAMRRDRLEGLQEIYERAMGHVGLATLWGRVDLGKRPFGR